MIKKLIYIFLIALVANSCTDELDYDNSLIGDGLTTISASVTFQPLVSTINDTSRSAVGDALKDLNDICVLIYDEDKKLCKVYREADLSDLKVYQKDTEGSNEDMASDAGVQAEKTTARATFTIKDLPFGKYYIYVVANMGEDFNSKDDKTLMTDFASIEALQKYEVTWNEKNIDQNDQMFGYFTPEGEEASSGFTAPELTLKQPRVNLHAWLKRAASKVTVVFDGSGLHENIWIYVKTVRIKDIPRYCKIGKENGVYSEKGKQDSLIVDGDCINYNQAGALPDNDKPSDDYKNWLSVSKGGGQKGAVSVSEKGDSIFHSEYAPALYFYENLQGNYPDQKKYDKRQDWDNVGYIPKPGEDDYKDNIPYGTYIEVEAYYVSQNQTNVSEGRIIYRFMLGQNVEYDYNASRNHHYKVTLGFKGYANQPDWHIAYIEPDREVFTDPTYYISYMYNQKAIFPIRIKGDVKQLDIEIVENNWAPYDPKSEDDVPPQTIGTGIMDFKWNRPLYLNKGKENVTNVNDYNASTSGYYYGLQKPYNSLGTGQITFSERQIEKGAPKYATPVWAGFLALQVPKDLTANVIYNKDDTDDFTEVSKLKNYFYTNNQNKRTFSREDLTFAPGETSKVVGTGNNACTITKAPDGSITVLLPMWTRQKSLLKGSGFSGNNPYDTYQRKAVVQIKATFPPKEGQTQDQVIERFKPVFQVRRVVNPKAVWRKWDDVNPFDVTLTRREGASSDEFKSFDSEGEWKAYVKTGNTSFITLEGGNRREGNAIIGNTGTPIKFWIKFNGTTGDAALSRCAIVEIEYHGFTCFHSIFVRQGYNTPLDVAGDGVKWSSYALYKFKSPLPAFGETYTENDYAEAELTASPLSLGTFFRRGNYNGILIENNMKFGVNVSPGLKGTFTMGDGSEREWREIEGLPYSDNYNGWNLKSFPSTAIQNTFKWKKVKATVNNEERYYRVPSYSDYLSLNMNCDFGIGVLYGDGSTKVATKVDDAYGFEDFNNDGNDNVNVEAGELTRGMRGVIVFNPANANQLFFPVGARGVGRRTIDGETLSKNSASKFGVLRYSRVEKAFDMTNARDQYRPIPYNTAASPGALYWFDIPVGSSTCWDCNYFDMNFEAYGIRTSFTPEYDQEDAMLKPGQSLRDYNITHGGDALPIKLIRDE